MKIKNPHTKLLCDKNCDLEFGDTIPNQKDDSGHVPEFQPVTLKINTGCLVETLYGYGGNEGE